MALISQVYMPNWLATPASAVAPAPVPSSPIIPPVSEVQKTAAVGADMRQQALAQNGVRFDLSQDRALPDAADRGVRFDFSDRVLDDLVAQSTGENQTNAAHLPATSADTRRDAAALIDVTFVSGKTSAPAASDEARLRDWAARAPVPQRAAALPLSSVTDATAAPAPQAAPKSLAAEIAALVAPAPRTLTIA